MKAFKIIFLTLIGISVVIVAAAAIFVGTFDANRYKPEIEQLVLEKTGRTLKIEGNINLTLWPSIGAELGRTTLSDKDPKQAFVTLNSTQVSVAVMPLLSGQVLVDGVAIDGLAANITRDKGGAFNFDDLIKQTDASPAAASTTTPASGAQSSSVASTQASSFQFDIGSIALTNSTISYTDSQNNMDLQVSELNLKTGQIAPKSNGRLEFSAKAQSKSMRLDALLNVNGDYKLDLPAQKINLDKLTTKLTGSFQDIKSIDGTVDVNLAGNLGAGTYTLNGIDGKLKANLAGQTADITIKTAEVNLADKQVSAKPSALTVSLKERGRSVDADLKLPAFVFANDQVDLAKLAANISMTDPTLGKDPLKVTASGDLAANIKAETLKTTLSGQFDGSPVKLTAGVTGFKASAITFDLALDQLKLDRFEAATNTANKGNEQQQASVAQNASTSPAPIDLSALKGHNVKGKVRIGKVVSKNLSIDQVQADVALASGKLSVSPHSAQLFGGKLAGSLTVDANTNTFAIKENITGIKLDSLLTALGQEPRVTGQGTLNVDLTTAGATIKALEQNLAGKASVNLKDGAVKGIDIGAIINNVRAMLGKAPTQQGTGSGQTTFTELTASATIQKGIATNRDLDVKAPLFRLEGAGTVDIPESSLDYLAKVAVVETSTGQGGQDLAALRGVTIPIKISGKFDSPKYTVDVGSLAAELAKSQLGDKAKEEINKVVPGLGDALKGLFGR